MWIASDVQTKQYLKEFQVDKNVRQRLNSISNSSERNFESNFFADENDIEQFFKKAGFNMEEYQDSNVTADLSSVRILNLSQQEMAKIQQGLSMLKALILIPRNAWRLFSLLVRQIVGSNPIGSTMS